MSVPSFAALEPAHIAVVASLSVFLIVLLLGTVIEARQLVRRRAMAGHAGSPGEHGLMSHEVRYGKRLLAKLEPLLSSKPGESPSQIRKELVQAGFFSALAVPFFFASRILLAIGLPLLVLLAGEIFPSELPSALIIFLMVCFAGLGLILPPILLDVLTKRMREKYRRAFPDFMDLLVVCVESGQSLASAFDRVGRELLEIFPQLAANLHLFNLELRAGSSLADALSNLHARVGLDEVQSLAVLLKQSEELGASISDTLRIFSDEMRDKRLSRAETKANQLPVKMTIPLGACIFPVILLLILVPVFIRINHSLL